MHLAARLPGHAADPGEEFAMRQVALVVRQDVALAGPASLLGEQKAGGDVAGVDVREPAVDS